MSLIVTTERSDIIPVEKKQEIIARIRKGLLGPLSPEREAGAFMLYCCGDDFESISLKTNFPLDIIYVTAAHYGWDIKAKALRSESGDFNPVNIQKNLANSLLIATYMSVQEELKDVLAGKKSASDCKLIPNNIKSLQTLMDMVSNVHNPGVAGNQGTVVHAQNVQINQVAEPKPEKKEENEIKYAVLKGEKK